MIAFNACVRQDGHLETNEIRLLRHLHIGSVQFSDLLNVFSPGVQFDYDVGGKSAAQTGNVVSPDMRKQSAGL